ncbi:unnamed protein product [Blepharisma stoltei]|uniref:EF-hand domain-containing protein n=1 Tax=Blepharisma stoltei TaxID=1481888 RepID=A0AAU9J4T7_9CILI|nr:unnamed protein product [Blepharisma stoltei]
MIRPKTSNATSEDNPFAIHLVPRYDVSGYPTKPLTANNVGKYRSPPGWSPPFSAGKTQKDLFEERKQEKIPDPTYDLDRDGYVSVEDYYVSSRFDVDKDGKLSKSERENAEKAISEGRCSENRWGLLAYQPKPRKPQTTTVRIEDITAIRGISTDREDKVFSNCKTQKELFDKRKAENRAIGHQAIEQIGENQIRVDYLRPLPEGYKENPIFKTQNFKNLADRNIARSAASLEVPSDIKVSPYEISMNFNNKPHSKTQKELLALRKHEMLRELHEKKNYNHISREARMNEREMQRLSIITDEDNFLTWNKIKNARKLETNSYNQKTFAALRVGMHGKELPHYTDTLKEYWKIKDSYDPNPENNSRTLFSMKQKFWAPKDKYRTADATGDAPEITTEYTAIPKPELIVAEKINHLCPFEGFDNDEEIDPTKNRRRPNTKYRMSTVVNYFIKTSADMGFNQSEEKAKTVEEVVTKGQDKKKKKRKEAKIDRTQMNTYSSQGTKITRSGSAPMLIKKSMTTTNSDSVVRSKGFIF